MDKGTTSPWTPCKEIGYIFPFKKKIVKKLVFSIVFKSKKGYKGNQGKKHPIKIKVEYKSFQFF